MKIVFGILILLAFLLGVSEAQIIEVPVLYPGASGLQSNYNVQTLSPENLYHCLNCDYWSKPGMIQRRNGLVNYGANTVSLYGAFGYHNGELGHSMAVGIRANADGYNVANICFSDTFGTNLGYGGLGIPFVWGKGYNDWTQFNDFLVYANNGSLPVVFTTSSPKMITHTGDDVNRYAPRAMSLGLEAPGQPRAGVYDSSGPLNGTFQYAFAYNGDPGIPSVLVFPVNQSVYLTNIPGADSLLNGSDTLKVLRKQINGLNDWYVIDTIYRPQDSEAIDIYIDNGGLPFDTTWYYTDGTVDSLNSCDTCGPILYWQERWNGQYSGGWNDWVGVSDPHCWAWSSDSVTGDFNYWRDDVSYTTDSLMAWWLNVTLPTMSKSDSCIFAEVSGGVPLGCYESFDSVVARWDSILVDTNATIWTGTGNPVPGQPVPLTGGESAKDICKVAYSFWDDITQMESPMGPAVSAGYDSVALGIDDSIIIVHNRQDPTKWVKIYQTVSNNLLVGANDTTVWYCALKVRLGNIMQNQKDTVFMVWADTAVANGLDTADSPSAYDNPYNFPRNIFGDVIIRPPYVYANQIPFSDMAYASERLAGIGDPIEPEYFYYSDLNSYYTNVWSWPPNNFLVINEGITGALIAVVRAEGFGRDAFYTMKRNAIYLVDIDNGKSVKVIEVGVGAVSRSAVVKHGSKVYFLSPDLRVYELIGEDAVDISDGVQDYFSNMFSSEVEAASNCRAFQLRDAVQFFDTSTGVGMSYDTKRGAWAQVSYDNDSSYVPIGSFVYDSTSSGIMGGYPTTVLYSDDGEPLKAVVDTAYDWGEIRFPYQFQLPYVGGQGHLWSLQKIQATLENKASYAVVRFQVVDERLTVLATGIDTLIASEDGNWEFYVPQHDPVPLLSVKFMFETTRTVGEADARNNVTFTDFIYHIEDRGRDNVN